MPIILFTVSPTFPPIEVYNTNVEKCSYCSQCESIKKEINQSLINVADARLYNIRFDLDRYVNYGLYRALRFYKGVIDDICSGENCNFCYGENLENILERARIISN